MSAAADVVAATLNNKRILRQAAPTVALIVLTAMLGAAGQSLARPVFILGCAIVSWDAMRLGAGVNFGSCLALFCFAPFLRRVVDVYTGYEPSGFMVSGPLIALTVPAAFSLVKGRQVATLDPALRPFLIYCACVFYGVILTIVSGELTQAASGAVKWLAPPCYGMWLLGAAQRDTSTVEIAAKISMILAPILGLYGFVQYIDPQIWDRYWMTYTVIASIGQPESFMVRVFSTMNAPAGYATFATAGLLLFGFRKRPLLVLVAAVPTMLGLLLSMYRTAWIALVAGIAVALLHPQTRRRATLMLIAAPLVGAAALMFTPAGDALQERLESFTTISQDASGLERLSEYADLLNADGGTLIGHGFGTIDVLQAGSRALDGQFVVTWYSFGLVLAIMGLCAVLWAAIQGIRGAWSTGNLSGLAVTSVLISLLMQIPLAVISASETGFLFWSFAAIGAAARSASNDQRPSMR